MHRFVFAALTSAAIFAASASAAPASVRVEGAPPGGYVVNVVTLQYDDQDVSSSPGAAALLNRIDSAAQAVCGSARPGMASQYAACRKTAVKKAVASVNAPALVQLAATK